MIKITDMGALALSKAIEGGEVSAVEVMAATLDQIKAVNPAVNAIVSLRDRNALMAEAKAADETPHGGWLHGIPMAIKDLAETKGLRTTLGSPIFADWVPEADCAMVARLKAAGAIIIGKTNTPEFGLGSHTTNPVHGATATPYDLTRTAGGSSGGAAAALATRMVSVADGSDMMGSLRNPAAYCNIYGFRPTWGRVPNDPIGDGYLHKLATNGPMARNMDDLYALLQTQMAIDPMQPAPHWPEIRDVSITPAKASVGVLGDWGGAYPMEDGVMALFQKAVVDLADGGCRVSDVQPPVPSDLIWQSWITLRNFSVTEKMRSLYEDPAKRDLLNRQAIWEIERGLSLTAEDIHKASTLRSDWYRAAITLFQSHDVLVLPSAQVFPFDKTLDWPRKIAGTAMDTYHRWMEIVIPASLLGLPALNVPIGFHNGLPMGMQIIGAPGQDRAVLALGKLWEELTAGRPEPSQAL